MLPDLITEARLLDAAGQRAFERGVAYFKSGAVVDLVDTGKAIKARVMGGEEYIVRFRAEGEQLAYECSCPVGDSGEFCKHAVAAGLAWLTQRSGAKGGAPRGDKELVAIREWLGAASREALVDLLIEQVEDDPGLRSRLLARAARAQALRHVDIKELKETVSKALAVHGFVDYHGMRRLLERAYPMVELISGLREDGHAGAAYEVAHHALKRGLAAYERSDDSGGAFGDLLHQIAAEHLQACRAAQPDPQTLGKQLFDFMRRDQWGLAAFEDYAPLLGDTGIKAFRAAAEKEWKKVPARGPAKSDTRTHTDHFQITHMMETLARHAGDTDALIAIKSRDLSSPYHFFQIATICSEAGRADEALDWAERGHAAFREHDSRLVDFLVDAYGARARHDDAIRLSWDAFVECPALPSYQRLKSASESAGTWSVWRDKTLDWIRKEYLPNVKKSNDRWRWVSGGYSLLVEIFLWEGNSDAALAEARAGRCTEDLWFRLAAAREAEHPRDAAEIYRARLDDIVGQGQNRAYDEAADLVAKIRTLMHRAGEAKPFADWLEAVKRKHKAKRNFMQRLGRALNDGGVTTTAD